MRAIVGLGVGVVLALGGCTVERIGPPGVTMTRAVAVAPRDVQVFETADMVRGSFYVVEELTVHDDGEANLLDLQRDLRAMAGARGANGLVLHPMNRRPNGTRVQLGLSLDDPFENYSATAIYIGDAPPPMHYLGNTGEVR
ncbi:hypothetical protein [Aurantiacibacter luteus]|uniref:hypothetical protein n=1 Tax=Aurantiacibacter luteus TaxID=1581420 RepID=UPI0012E00EC7|nr:hypothetical protein [Aurantiacibacter luteus]